MASSNKTQYLGLNFWAATDPVLRDDFNADNQKLDSALGPILSLPGLYYASGSWVGDGKTVGPGLQLADMSLNFDFEPLIVFIDWRDKATNKEGTILFRPCTQARCTSSNTVDDVWISLTWSATGVRWHAVTSTTGNVSGGQYNYNYKDAVYVYGAIGRRTP